MMNAHLKEVHMLICALLAATVVVTPTNRVDNAGRDHWGVQASLYRSNDTPWSGGLFYEQAFAETTTEGNTTYLIPGIRSFGAVAGLDLAGTRPYAKFKGFGWLRTDGSRFALNATLRVGIRRYWHDIPAFLKGTATERFIQDQRPTNFLVTPGLTSQFFVTRYLALQAGIGWEFGDSSRSYRRLQSTFALSTQF